MPRQGGFRRGGGSAPPSLLCSWPPSWLGLTSRPLNKGGWGAGMAAAWGLGAGGRGQRKGTAQAQGMLWRHRSEPAEWQSHAQRQPGRGGEASGWPPGAS